MRTLVIGDIHGGFRALIQILDSASIKPTDKLIFLGDYVDGWSESPELLDFLLQLQQQNECVFIRGNHDDLLCDWLDKGTENQMWHLHGGESTVKAYKNVDEQTKQNHIQFLKSLSNFHIDSDNRLYVHAGFTNMHGIEQEYFPGVIFWDRTLWETAMSLDKSLTKDSKYYPKRLTLYHEIYIGHTPVTRLGESTPMNFANVWNVDTGAAFKGVLTIMDVETKEYFQSDPLTTLYPEECGRNNK